MPITVEQVRLAINAVADAPPAERRQRMVALFEAAVQLRDLTSRYHDWLVKEDAWLNANALELEHGENQGAAFIDREVRYLKRVVQYQEAMDVLTAALETVRDATDGSVPKAKRGVWRQIGVPPFGLIGFLVMMGGLIYG